MATPVWNQLAAPNFSASNALISQAMEQLTRAGEGLEGVAKTYKDNIQKRNLGLIQEYVNSAKTPEELQSEAFKTGLDNRIKAMGGDYDTLAKAQLVDKAYDSLLSRKANQVSIFRNEFGLTQDQLEANQKQAISNIFAINDPAMRQAAIDQAVKDKQFNSSLYLQTLAAELTGKTNQQTYDYNAETWDTRKEALRLGNVSTEHAMKIADRNAATAEMNAETNRLQALAAAAKAEEDKNKTKNAYIATGMSAIDTARKGVQNTIYGSGLNTDPEKSWKKWHEKTTSGLLKFDPAPNKVVELIDKHPALKKLPDNLKILHAENALRGLREDEAFSNPAWGFTSGSEEAVLKRELEKSYKDFNQQAKIAEDNAVIPLYRKLVMEHAQKTGAVDGEAAAKSLGLDELTIYKAGIPSRLASELKLKYQSTDKSIPEDQWIENQIEIATNPDYASLNKPLFPESKAKAIPSETIKFNSPAMQMAGFADYGTAFRFEEREAEKAAQQLKASAKANQAQTGTSLQQAAITPIVNSLVSTPLNITTNPSTVKTKPVADPLRQAALEQTPVATSNTAQTRQLTTALAAQEQRMQNRARLSLEAQEALQNGQPFVVPAITAKLEETKPRELTPAEVAQGERMQQAALSRLIGAKLEEKQALARKTFPYASLTPINKATEPLSNTSIPLIQSLLELPVIKNTAKITTIAELDALVNKARKSIPNFDDIAFVQSLDIDPLLKEAYLNRE